MTLERAPPSLLFKLLCVLWFGGVASAPTPTGESLTHALDVRLTTPTGNRYVAVPQTEPKITHEDDVDLVVVGAPPGTITTDSRHVHIYDWKMERWVTFWAPGFVPPAVVNLTGDKDSTMKLIDDGSQTTQAQTPAVILQELEAPTFEHVTIPNIDTQTPTLYQIRSPNTEKELWLVTFSAFDVTSVEVRKDLNKWLSVSETRSTMVYNVERLSFSIGANEELCWLDFRVGMWTCAADDGMAYEPEPAINIPTLASNTLMVLGGGMDQEEKPLRFAAEDDVWSMQIKPASAEDDSRGNAILFMKEASALLPSLTQNPKPALPSPDSTPSREATSTKVPLGGIFTTSNTQPNVPVETPVTVTQEATPTQTQTPTTTSQWPLMINSLVLALLLLAIKAALESIIQGIKKKRNQSLPTQEPKKGSFSRSTEKHSFGDSDKDRWTISGRVLGKGAFGTVYEGLDRITGQIVAVKEIPLNQAEPTEKEVTLLASLQHPNIVQYLGSFTAGKDLALVMEYVPCGSLESILKTYKFIALPALRMYATDILRGLRYLHHHTICHRDIKPANILTGQDGKCKLADFGLSRCIGEVDIYKSLNAQDLARTIPVGTPAYMSPEAIQGTPVMASDIWAVGLTLCELATGDKPWSHLKATQPLALVLAIVREAQDGYHPPDWIPHNFEHFLERCLKPDHNDRSTADELLDHKWLTTGNAEDASCKPPRFRKASLKGHNKDLIPLPSPQKPANRRTLPSSSQGPSSNQGPSGSQGISSHGTSEWLHLMNSTDDGHSSVSGLSQSGIMDRHSNMEPLKPTLSPKRPSRTPTPPPQESPG